MFMRSRLQSALQRRQHLDRRAAVDLEPCPLLEIGDRRLALRSDVPVRVAADVIAASLQQRLQFLPPFPRQQRIVGRPWRDYAASAAEAIGQNAGGEGVGFRPAL